MRLVVKVGTSTLTHSTGLLNIRRVERLCKTLADIENSGHQVILVSSGAIGMGVGKLNLDKKPTDMATKQAAAAVGQCELMYIYDKMFGEYNHTVAQILLTGNDVDAFIDAGADILLLPAPGTVPGITMEYAHKLIARAHAKGALAMTTIGTSQEGADEATIREIALMCKMAGADIHHIGDSGYMGMAIPDNLTAYSIAIRGKRHTYRRMAMSLLR